MAQGVEGRGRTGALDVGVVAPPRHERREEEGAGLTVLASVTRGPCQVHALRELRRFLRGRAPLLALPAGAGMTAVVAERKARKGDR